MVDRVRVKFEKQLMNKLSQKCKTNQTEENLLMQSFKFFDINNNGQVDLNNFRKAIERIGVIVEDPDDINRLFGLYDKDKSGKLNYQEFSAILFGKESAYHNKAADTEPVIHRNIEVNELLKQFRQKIKSRGAKGLIGLQRLFKIMDDDNSKSLNYVEFNSALKDFRMGLDQDDSKRLFNAFDKQRNGIVDYDEFLRVVRGDMNPERINLVMKVYAKIDVNNNGIIDITDVKGVFNASRHPAVLEGRKTEEQVLSEFLETFEMHHCSFTGTMKDAQVTKEEFIEYYTNISASIDNDQYFALMINNAWNLDKQASTYATYQKGWASEAPKGTPTKPTFYTSQKNAQSLSGPGGIEESKEYVSLQERYECESVVDHLENMGEYKQKKKCGNKVNADMPKYQTIILERFRDKLLSRGGRGIIGLARQFKIFDDNGSGSLDQVEFKKAIRDFRIEMDERDTAQLIKIFDHDKNGEINFNEFLRTMVGEMNEFRKGLVQRAFITLDKDKSGNIDINDIRKAYNAQLHPDVKNGKKTEDEVLTEFLETFETHHNVMHDFRPDSKVSLEEFFEYYNNISCSVENDAYFDLMMNNAWNLDLRSNKQNQPYAGVSSKVYGVNAKQVWKYDHHRNIFSGEGEEKEAPSSPYSLRKGPTKTTPYQYELEADKVHDKQILLQTFQEKLKQRGARGIVGLQRIFKIIDDNNSGTLDIAEFTKCLKDLRLTPNPEDAKILFSVFDMNNDGAIMYDEFLRVVRGEMNQFRRNIVDKAFGKMDKTGNLIVDIEDLKGVYNAENHPDVRMGKKTEDEILSEFLDTFEVHFATLHGAGSKDRMIDLNEFREYYNNISMSIENDQYFELMMNNAYNLQGQPVKKAAWAGEY